MNRMGVKIPDRDVVERCRYETMEDLLAALGSGELSDTALDHRLTQLALTAPTKRRGCPGPRAPFRWTARHPEYRCLVWATC